MAAVALLLVELLLAAPSFARPYWIQPQEIGSLSWRINVDGKYADETGSLTGSASGYEYIKGRIIPLENLIGDRTTPPSSRGEAYVQIHAKGSVYQPGMMYIGVRLPRFWDVDTKVDHGRLELYFGFDTSDPCAQDGDRRISLDFTQFAADAVDGSGWPTSPILRTVSESKGVWPGVSDCVATAPLGTAEPVLGAARVDIEDFLDQKGPYVFVELEIRLPASVYAEKKLRFGMRFDDRDYASVTQPTQWLITLPTDVALQEDAGKRVTWGFEDTYQVVDLAEPRHTDLGVAVYNVGQLLDLTDLVDIVDGPDVDLDTLSDFFVGDGGVGDEEDLADAVWSRDVVCLAEIMPLSDRKALLAKANEIRAAKNLPPFNAVNVVDDEEPNNVILTSWTVLESEKKLFQELDPIAYGPDDFVALSSRGAKGVVWARIAPPSRCTYGIDPTTGKCRADRVDASNEWLDVFCAHTQAPCSPSGGIACDDAKDHHNDGERQEQFAALGKYIRLKRGLPSVDGSEDGFSRPAILLGDLNQVGPRSMPDAFGDAEMAAWLGGFAPAGDTDIKNDGYEPEIAAAYKGMREKLGNWGRTEYDAALMAYAPSNPDRYVQYDISADTGGEGSWIGTEGLGQVGPTKADECTPTLPDLRKNVRVDYVMVIPATVRQPSYALQYVPGKPARAQVDRHFSAAEEGCLSDHAEVFADVRLVMAKEPPPPPNKYRGNRLRYWVAKLDDIQESDDTLLDDGETDWYSDAFRITIHDAVTGAEVPGSKCSASWPREITPAGRISHPGWWYSSKPIAEGQVAKTWLEVWDYDSGSDNDQYDGHVKNPCKHMEFRFVQDTNLIWEEGCGLSLWDPVAGGATDVATSTGNSNVDNVHVTHTFAVCSVSQDPFCDEKCAP